VVEGRTRPAWAEVDLGAVAHNVALLKTRVAPAALCAVVKAGGYGHGAVRVAETALGAGATWLAVALVDEGIELREAGVRAPVLVLAEPPPGSADAVVAAGLDSTVASAEAAASLAAAARRAGTQAAVHVKVDTGMHRLGVAPGALGTLVSFVDAEPALRLEGIFTHLAVADSFDAVDRAFTATQLEFFEKVVAELPLRPRLLHVANSAAAVAWPASRYDLARCGIALYGLAPSVEMARGAGEKPGGWEDPGDAAASFARRNPKVAPEAAGAETVAADAIGFFARLRPVLSLKARVSAVRELEPGARPSYGRLRALTERSVVATVPIGYADGVRRAMITGGFEVLVGGRRRPLAGAVTMDQLLVDCGPGSAVAPGDEVVLLGRQGDEEVTAAEWAQRLGTIPYEVVCAIGPRVPRVVVRDPAGQPSGVL
jgi:alanine racemase